MGTPNFLGINMVFFEDQVSGAIKQVEKALKDVKCYHITVVRRTMAQRQALDYDRMRSMDDLLRNQAIEDNSSEGDYLIIASDMSLPENITAHFRSLINNL